MLDADLAWSSNFFLLLLFQTRRQNLLQASYECMKHLLTDYKFCHRSKCKRSRPKNWAFIRFRVYLAILSATVFLSLLRWVQNRLLFPLKAFQICKDSLNVRSPVHLNRWPSLVTHFWQREIISEEVTRMKSILTYTIDCSLQCNCFCLNWAACFGFRGVIQYQFILLENHIPNATRPVLPRPVNVNVTGVLAGGWWGLSNLTGSLFLEQHSVLKIS